MTTILLPGNVKPSATALDYVQSDMSLVQWNAIQQILNQQVPNEAIQTRPGKSGKTFDYVSHGYVTRVLNDAFGHKWSGKVVPGTVQIGETGVLVLYELTVWIGGQEIVKVEPGWKEYITNYQGDRVMSLGDTVKSAVSDGLRRCAMRLGVGLNLYAQEEIPTPATVKADLAAYAKRHLGWSARETFDYLKELGYSESDLVPSRNEMYHALAKVAGKVGEVDEKFTVDDETDTGNDGAAATTVGDEPVSADTAANEPKSTKGQKVPPGTGRDPAELIQKGKEAMQAASTQPKAKTPPAEKNQNQNPPAAPAPKEPEKPTAKVEGAKPKDNAKPAAPSLPWVPADPLQPVPEDWGAFYKTILEDKDHKMGEYKSRQHVINSIREWYPGFAVKAKAERQDVTLDEAWNVIRFRLLDEDQMRAFLENPGTPLPGLDSEPSPAEEYDWKDADTGQLVLWYAFLAEVDISIPESLIALGVKKLANYPGTITEAQADVMTYLADKRIPDPAEGSPPIDSDDLP